MRLRSLLFVPGDRPDRFEKAASSGADAVILDLEDSVSPSQKDSARQLTRTWLEGPRTCPALVRINPLDSKLAKGDLDAVLTTRPDGIVLPKCEGASDIAQIVSWMGKGRVPILPIATETPAAVFELGSYRQVSAYLTGLTWGAEDLPAAIGATTAREADGRYTPPYDVARSLTLFAAHAAQVAAIDTVFPDFRDLEGLAAYATRARRDGYTGMLAIHPSQVPVINEAFRPTDAEVAHAREIVDAFAANPDAGALNLNGRMIDRPHLVQAQRVLDLVK